MPGCPKFTFISDGDIPFELCNGLVDLCGGQNVSHPNKVVNTSCQAKYAFNQERPAKTELIESSNSLHPSEDLLDQFAFPLADNVSGMSCGPSIDGAANHPGSDMGRHELGAAALNEAAGVVPFVGAEGRWLARMATVSQHR